MKKLNDFINNTETKNLVLYFIGLFLIVAGISWGVFTLLSKSSGITSNSSGNQQATNTITARPGVDLSQPKTEACPINGMKYTVAEKKVWDTRRPITAMIENHADSRPPNGLSRADWVYEAVAEGGITRYLAVFYCGVAANDVQIAPVRSSRVYFINWASEYGDRPLYTHVGGANDICPTCYGGVKSASEIDPRVDAIGLLAKIGWRIPGGNDLDAGYDSGYPVFFRNYDRVPGKVLATEHTMMVSTDALYKDAADNRGLGAIAKNGIAWTQGFVPYKFVDGSRAGSTNATDISFAFWSNQPDYDVEWKYDANNNQYLRFDGGQPHIDQEFKNAQMSAKNVIVMEVKETGPVDSEKHMIEQNIGTGNILVFQNGTVLKGTWSKASRTDRTKFMDANGKSITLNAGVTWVEAIPTGNVVNYH